MELNKVIRFLENEGWTSDKSNSKFVFYTPPVKLGFEKDFSLPVPSMVYARDFDRRLTDTVNAISQIYESDPEALFYDVSNYLEILKKDAIYFKLDSNEVLFGHTLEIEQIIQFLHSLKKSYSSYLKIKFTKDFSDFFKNSSSNISSIANRVLNYSALRLINLKYQSFSFGVSADIMMGNDKIDVDNITEWRKQIIPNFRKEVVDIDYNSDEDIEFLLKNFNNEERKLIFDPLVKAINNDDYQVSLTNSKFQKIRSYHQIPSSTVKEILPKKDTEVKKPNLEMVQIIIPMDKSKEKIVLKTESITEDLFANVVKETKANIESVMYNGINTTLNEPIEVTVKMFPEINEFIAEFDPLNYKKSSNQFDRIKILISQDIQKFVDRYEYLNKNNQDVLSEEDKRIVDFFHKHLE